MKRLFLCLLLLLGAASAQGKTTTSVPSFDHSEWNQFLQKFVNAEGEVDYQSAFKDRTLLVRYLRKLHAISPQEFKKWPREERLALFINAFNAGVVKSILRRYPVKTVLDIPGFWDNGIVLIASKARGNTYSLNLILEQILRRQFRDEKALFALVYGAKGSPRLRREAYDGRRLEGQLYLAVKEFVNDGTKNEIKVGEKKLVLSRLFKWYGKDLLLNWGNFVEEVKWDPEEMAALSLVVHYLEDPAKVKYMKESEYKVKYALFDWRLNDRTPANS